jgi:hypothetical protein
VFLFEFALCPFHDPDCNFTSVMLEQVERPLIAGSNGEELRRS